MNVFDRVKARNDALWNALTSPSAAVREAEFERAFSDAPEQCPACKGTGAEASGTSYGGQSEMLACDKCDGTGAAAESIVRCRCCDQGKVKQFHCPACNDLDRAADRETGVTP